MEMDLGPPPPETPIQGQVDLDEDRPVDFAVWIEEVGHYAIEVKGGKYCPKHRNEGERTS